MKEKTIIVYYYISNLAIFKVAGLDTKFLIELHIIFGRQQYIALCILCENLYINRSDVNTL